MLKTWYFSINFDKRCYSKYAVCFFLFSVLSANAAAANDKKLKIEEVAVTAERRTSSLQTVAIAISSFTQHNLETQQVFDIGDLQTLVPNLSVHVGDANNAVVYIRGVGQVDSIAFFEPGVGIYLDEVYLGRAQGAFLDVIDVERIEVLRGPQGSLYGRNTVGGAIKYVSAGATEHLSGKISATAGNYQRRDIKTSISGPVIDNVLLARVTAAHLQRDGYSSNSVDGHDDGDQQTRFFRGVLEYNPADNLTVQWAADYTRSDPNRSRTPAKQTPIDLIVFDPYTFAVSTVPFAADEDPFKVNADFNKLAETQTQGSDINITWQLSDQLTLKSISSYRELEYATEVDLDATPINAFGIFYYNDQRQISQEFQLSFQDKRLSAVSGLYYFNEQGDIFDGGIFSHFLSAVSGISEFSTHSYALFGQFDLDVTDRLSATFGFRYTEEEKNYQRLAEDFDLTLLAGISIDPVTSTISYTNPRLLSPRSTDLRLGGGIGVARPLANPDSADFDNFSPKLGLKYQFDANTQIYANVASSFKSGGFNGRLADDQLEPYDEETLTSLEIGFKSHWLGDRLRFNSALFHNDYNDLQVSSFETTADGNAILPIFTNAGKAVIQGIEIELAVLVTQSLTVTANVGYLDAEYKEYFAAVDSNTNTVVDVSDDRKLVNSPEWDTFLAANYRLPIKNIGTLTFLADIAYRSKTYLEVNSSENLAQGGYSVINAAMVFESANEQWQLMLGGKNLSDKAYRTHAFDLSAFPGVELGYYNAPRTYSLSASYHF